VYLYRGDVRNNSARDFPGYHEGMRVPQLGKAEGLWTGNMKVIAINTQDGEGQTDVGNWKDVGR